MISLLLCWMAQDPVEIEHVSLHADGNLGVATAKPAGRLRVVVGGALKPRTAFDREFLESAGLDAVALGADELDAAADFGRLPYVCANLVDESTGKTVVRSHVVVRRTAFVGIAKAGRGAKLPKGWRLEDPAEVLKKLIPEIAKSADRVILLAVMDRVEVAKIVRDLPGIAAAFVPARGANDPESLQVGKTWLCQSPDGSGVVGRFAIASGANEFVRADLSEQDWKRLHALAAKHGLSHEKFVSKQKPTGGIEEGPATSFEPGKPRRVWVEAKNRALEARAESFHVTREVAGRKAADGRAWLVVGMEWTNAIPMSYVFGNEKPVAFHIGDFREILFVVVNGTRLARLEADLTSGPGGITETEFKLEYLGSSRRGFMVFDVPAAGIESLEVRFYDFTHGHMRLPLLVKDAPAAKPVVSAKNELLEAEVASVWKEKNAVHVDLRARSAWTIEVDATAFDPKAQKGDRMRVATLGRWEDLHKLVSLVVDGEIAIAPEGTSRLGDATLLLPDAATGGELVFLVPDTAKSIELRIDFVPMGVPDRGEPLLPEPLTLALEGTRPKHAERKVLATAQDGDVRIDVISKSIATRFEGAEGRFLAVEFSVHNSGEGRLFDTRESVKYLPDQGEPIGIRDAVDPGPRFLPKGERRVFRVTFEIDEKARKHRIAFGEQTLEVP